MIGMIIAFVIALTAAAGLGVQIGFRRGVRFAAQRHAPALIDLTSHLSLQDGVGAVQALHSAAQWHPARALLGASLDAETLFQHAQRFARLQGAQQLWVTPGDAKAWLGGAQAQIAADRLPAGQDDQDRLRHELLAQWEAALSRALRRARLAYLTLEPLLEPVTQAHANFPVQTLPDGQRRMGYRVESMLAQDVVKSAVEALRKGLQGARVAPKGWDRIVAALREEAGEIDLKDTLSQVLEAIEDGTDRDALGPPLPRLHIPQHLYNPLLLATHGQSADVGAQLDLLDDQPVALRISPPPLHDSEARLVWDVRRRWGQMHGHPKWSGVDVVLLRNLAGVGVGLFAAEGFFPDFLLWLKRGARQALAFVEPKGLRHQWPADKFELLDRVVPSWNFSVPVRGCVLSANSADELDKIRPGFSWASAPSVLLHQDAQGDYVERILSDLLALVP